MRPTARRVLRALRADGPQHVDQLAARLTATSRRPIRPTTVATALRELEAAALAAIDSGDQDELVGRWTALPVERDPLLDSVDLHGAHDFRHTTPEMAARVIDAVQQRLTVVLRVAEDLAENYPNRSALRVF